MAQECRWHRVWQPHCVLCEVKKLAEAAERERDEATARGEDARAAARWLFALWVEPLTSTRAVESAEARRRWPWLREEAP